MKQVTAVFNSVCLVKGVKIEDGVFGGNKVELSRDEKGQVLELVVAGLMSGEVEMSEDARKKYVDVGSMKGYARGLVANWLNKDKRLNGGVKYEIKSPGSRGSKKDEVLESLKALKGIAKSDEDRLKIDAEISRREAELAAMNKVKISTEGFSSEMLELAKKLGA